MFDEFPRFFSELFSVISDDLKMNLSGKMFLLIFGLDENLEPVKPKYLPNNLSILSLHLSNVRWTDWTGMEAECLFPKNLLLIIFSRGIGGADDERPAPLFTTVLMELLPLTAFNCTPFPPPVPGGARLKLSIFYTRAAFLLIPGRCQWEKLTNERFT
jgi:hypothetical protein